LRRSSPQHSDRWHLDEVFLKINGRIHYRWRAVDQDGNVLDILSKAGGTKKQQRSSFAKLLKLHTEQAIHSACTHMRGSLLPKYAFVPRSVQ
jgi:transposase-like protein